MEQRKNQTQIESQEKIEKQRRSLIAAYLTQLATGIGQKVTPERVALYCRGLSDIGLVQLEFAFQQALRHLGDFLPSIEKLRLWAEAWRPADVIQDSSHILDRGDKPPGWEPLAEGELETLKREARERAMKLLEQVKATADRKSMAANDR